MRARGRRITIAMFAAFGLAGAVCAAEPRSVRVAAVQEQELSGWDLKIEQLLQGGELRVRQVRADTLIPGRTHERFDQLHKGVPVFGGELVRQTDGRRTVSIFGTFYEGLDLEVQPAISSDAALKVVQGRGATPFGPERTPELTILPKGDAYVLSWRLRTWNGKDIRVYFIDARTGAVTHEYSDLQRQSAVGIGTGVLSDRKKVSARSQGSGFVADDKLRPPAIRTYDFKGDIFAFLAFFNSPEPEPSLSDLASDSDNNWTDGADVDAHTYAGYTYDFYYKRFGRRGLDNDDITLVSITHPVNREDIFASPNNGFIGELYLNAFYAGNGLMVYGEGLPRNLVDLQGRSWNYVAGGLDIVAHELTHGVTSFSSRLIYRGESGALNESFSDMMGTSAEFFFQPPGNGPLKADYLIGEDVITPGGLRSMRNPNAYGDPTHYSQRFLGPDDNGGVHTNSGIPNNAFYLAIEGGTNPVSGISVTGVGAGNREQIEKTFYRAFVLLLPSSANFSTARAATIQSARDLYGAGGAVEQAVTRAWAAVGVN